MVVAVLGIALAAPAQRSHTVQPHDGQPPDQAVTPDLSTQLPAGQQEQFPVDDVAPPTEPAAAPAAQQPPATAPPAPPPPVAAAKVETPPPPPVVPAKTAEGRKLQQETAVLLQLAQDLKAEIQKAGTNTLSLNALRKADEIQKMSKTLREEMSRQEQTTPGK